jgi:hypothetical protein
MTTVTTIRERIETRKAASRAEAAATWDKLVSAVFNNGNRTELSEKQLEQLDDAAIALGLEDYPDKFCAAVEALERADQFAAKLAYREKLLPKCKAATNKKFAAAKTFIEACLEERKLQTEIAEHAGENGEVEPCFFLRLGTLFLEQERIETSLATALQEKEDLRQTLCGK